MNSYKNIVKFILGYCKWFVEMWFMKSLGNKILIY